MVSGVIMWALVGMFVAGMVMLLCRLSYLRGEADGRREDALAWCEAFKNMKAPDWRDLPVPPQSDPTKQQAANKMYVEVFTAAKELVRQEIVEKRLTAVAKDLASLKD